MGNRVHVVKKQREYGSTDAFNWAFEEFKYLLTSLGCNVCEQDDYSSDFEMTCDEYERAMTILKRIIDAHKNDKDMDLNDIDFSDLASSEDTSDWDYFNPDDYDFNHVIECAEKLEGYSIDEILEIMKIFWEERDKNSSYIQFYYF